MKKKFIKDLEKKFSLDLGPDCIRDMMIVTDPEKSTKYKVSGLKWLFSLKKDNEFFHKNYDSYTIEIVSYRNKNELLGTYCHKSFYEEKIFNE